MLELAGENPFKIRAYENGAKAILGYSGDLTKAVETGELRSVKGIGSGLFANVETLVRTGRLAYYDELRSKFPPGLRECLRVAARRTIEERRPVETGASPRSRDSDRGASTRS